MRPLPLSMPLLLRESGPAAWWRWCFAASCLACGDRLPLGDDGAWCLPCLPGIVRLHGTPASLVPGEAPLPVTGLLAYGGPVAAAVLRVKGNRRLPDLAPLADDLAVLAHRIARIPPAGDRDAASPPVLVAVAPHLGRLRERGLHLPDLLTAALAAATGWPRRFVLTRHDEAEMRRTDRAAVPRFSARAGRNRRAVLVDDVVTTGQTLQAAALALRRAGWDVAGAVCLADARPHVLAGADTG